MTPPLDVGLRQTAPQTRPPRRVSLPANSILPIGVGHDQTGCPAPHLWDGRGDGCSFLWKPAECRGFRRMRISALPAEMVEVWDR